MENFTIINTIFLLIIAVACIHYLINFKKRNNIDSDNVNNLKIRIEKVIQNIDEQTKKINEFHGELINLLKDNNSILVNIIKETNSSVKNILTENQSQLLKESVIQSQKIIDGLLVIDNTLKESIRI